VREQLVGKDGRFEKRWYVGVEDRASSAERSRKARRAESGERRLTSRAMPPGLSERVLSESSVSSMSAYW